MVNLTPVLEVDDRPEFASLPSTVRVLCKQDEREIEALSAMVQALLDRGAERGKHFILLSARAPGGAPPGLLLCASDNWFSLEDLP